MVRKGFKRWQCDGNLLGKLIPLLVGHAEVAEILGVSKQHLSVYIKRGKLPPTLQVLASGPIWTRQSILDYKSSQEVKNGL